MTDNKSGRDEQTGDEDRQQQEPAREGVRDRADEPAPVHDEAGHRLGDLDEALESHEYPATTQELMDGYGDYEIETQDGSKSVSDVLAPLDNETYDSADDARTRIQGLIHRG